MSALGKCAFLSYWREVLLRELGRSEEEDDTVDELAELTGIDVEDIGSTLKSLGLARKVLNKWEVSFSGSQLRRAQGRCESRNQVPRLDLALLVWLPGAEDGDK
jgi:histone acetyltransferase MYST1